MSDNPGAGGVDADRGDAAPSRLRQSALPRPRARAPAQRDRERDYRGRIVATLDDYAEVRSLIGELVAEGVDAGVSPAVRQTVEAARTLTSGKPFVTPKMIEEKLGIGRSATYSRIRAAVSAGYLADASKTDERGMKLVVGAALHGDADSFLPTVDDIVRLSSTGQGRRTDPHGYAENNGSSGCPASPPDTDGEMLTEHPAA